MAVIASCDTGQTAAASRRTGAVGTWHSPVVEGRIRALVGGSRHPVALLAWIGQVGRVDNVWVEALETTAQVRARMSLQKSRNTQVELALRRALHAAGLRFRVHRRPVKGVRREADIVFGPARVAVFVDGCFWHGCPEHGTWPRRNADFWRTKIEGNRVRDTDTDERLGQAGWLAVRVWEHESPWEAAERVRAVVEERRRRR